MARLTCSPRPPAAERPPDDERILIHGDEAIAYVRRVMKLNEYFDISDTTVYGPLRGMDDYHDWSVRMRNFLRSRRLERFIFGSCERPAGQCEDGWDWDGLSSYTVMILRKNLGDDTRGSVSALRSPKEIWKTLNRMFGTHKSPTLDILRRCEGTNEPETFCCSCCYVH